MPNQEKILNIGEKQEKEHLSYTLDQYRNLIEETKQRMEAMPSLYRDNPDLLVEMMVAANNQAVYLQRGLSKPYFARIDFTEFPNNKNDEKGSIEKYYIGKLGVSDIDDHIITVDWRAPVSTLYYDSNLGDVSYHAPQGVVYGDMSLKRQIEVENGRLVSFRDVDTVSNDDLLKPYLGVNADNRLKNIVASIQGEQNKIIREDLLTNLIVQGAAGSGKTTVALHRIAYLVYTYRNTVKPSQYMIIGPNQFFINYISSVLPDLDVNSVPETTFQGFANDFLEESFHLADPALQLTQAIEGKYEDGVEYFKSSMSYKDSIDLFLLDFEKSIVPEEDFKIMDMTIIPAQTIRELYDSLEDAFYDTMQSKVNKCISTFSATIENNKDYISHAIASRYQEQIEGKSSQEVDKLLKTRATLDKDLANGCRNSLKKYFSRINTKVILLYKTFLQNCTNYLPSDFSGTLRLQNEALQGLKKKFLFFEDLPALIYIKQRIKGSAKFKQYRHAVIDEAQDFGAFHFYVLKQVMKECTFTIVGDLAQSIFQYRSILSWNQVIQESFQGKAILSNMEKSYRTTVEIMKAANLIMQHLGMPEAVPVIRHGKPVGYHQTEEAAPLILKLVADYLAEGFVSVAIISKTAQESEYINAQLQNLGLEAEHIESASQQYKGGVCTITGYLAKGLEFDGVILSNAGEEVYSQENKLDSHLLYVAMTRPLHRLDVIYRGTLTLSQRTQQTHE